MRLKVNNPLLYIILLSCSLISCSSDEPGVQGRTERKEIVFEGQSRGTCESISDFHTRFTNDVVNYYDNRGKRQNIIISPLSASITLGMLANGVDDTASKQIFSYLGEKDIDALNKFHSTLIKELPIADSKAKMAISNMVFYKEGLSLNDGFKSAMKSYYNPDLKSINFSNTNKAKEVINNWIERNTDGRIKDFNDDIDPTTLAVFLNAVCFQNVWKEDLFNKNKTKSDVFHGLNGDTEVKYMISNEGFDLSVSDHLIAVILPFGNGSYNFMMMVPRNCDIFEAKKYITAEEIRWMRHNSRMQYGPLKIPKFKISSKTDLSDIVKESGVENFNSLGITMFDEELSNRTAILTQGCSFQIDEEGVKSSAVTQASLSVSSNVNPSNSSGFTVDEPFYFFVTEYSTGVCLLSGRIVDL